MNRYSLSKLALLAGVLVALEATLLDACSVKGARAEALLALACFAALFARDSGQGLLASWLIGLFKDFGSAGPLGLHAFLFLGTGWAVLQVRQVLFRESPVTQVVVSFIAACGVAIASALFVALTAGGVPWAEVLTRTLLTGVLTAALAPLLLMVLMQARWLLR